MKGSPRAQEDSLCNPLLLPRWLVRLQVQVPGDSRNMANSEVSDIATFTTKEQQNMQVSKGYSSGTQVQFGLALLRAKSATSCLFVSM